MKPFSKLVFLMLVSGMALAGGIACGQSAFDVVSIKPYVPPGALIESCNPHDDPVTLMRTGCTLMHLIEQAYNLKPYQVRVKGPAWISVDRYVVQARLAQPATRAEMLQMLQPVLTARFHLSIHWENHQTPVYLLQVAAHGPKLAPATNMTQCGAIFVGNGVMRSDCQTMDDFASDLETAVVMDRPVVNQTGLGKDERHKINLEFSSGDDPAAGPSIFSALPDQLGLTLKPGKAPLKTLVIDRARPPEPN
jgi:bla regulator protein blaR1